MLNASSVSVVLDVYGPERALLIELLTELNTDQWLLPTECPAYDIKGIATHVLGDDFSLLSRQRDTAQSGAVAVAAEMPGAPFRDVLNAFNDRWVATAGFFSTELLLELLRLSGDWTLHYYSSVDPSSEGEFVGLFGGQGPTSPFWQVIAREFLERWVHHSQIRRALGLGSVASAGCLGAGVAAVAAIARADDAGRDERGIWSLGTVILGDDQQTADVLTRGLTVEAIRSVVTGPPAAVEQLSLLAGRSS